MRVHFEELSEPKRAGGVDAATTELVAHLAAESVEVTRSSQGTPPSLPECVHVHGIWSPGLARRFRAWRARGVPCVVSPHGMLEPWAMAHKRWKKRIAWWLYQKRLLDQAAVLHGTSRREVANFTALGLRNPGALVPWGVTLPPRGERSGVATARTVLFVGRLYPVKGLPMLIEAWAQVRPAGWRLRLVGPDEAGHRQVIEALVQKHGLEREVEFTGALSGAAKARAFESAELFILPSYTENFGMAIAEALSHGLPVIATTGAPWEELVSHRCGWRVEPAVSPLAGALREATEISTGQRREMGARGRQLVEAHYTWRQAAHRLGEIYRWVSRRAERPDCVAV